MNKIVRRIQHNVKMKRLNKKIDYVFGKMKECEKNTDSREWRSWAQLNLMYIMLMSNEVEKYAQKIES